MKYRDVLKQAGIFWKPNIIDVPKQQYKKFEILAKNRLGKDFSKLTTTTTNASKYITVMGADLDMKQLYHEWQDTINNSEGELDL